MYNIKRIRKCTITYTAVLTTSLGDLMELSSYRYDDSSWTPNGLTDRKKGNYTKLMYISPEDEMYLALKYGVTFHDQTNP